VRRDSPPPVLLWAKRLLWLALCLAVCLYFGRDFVKNLRPPGTLILDFVQEWASARNYWRGLPVYTPHEESYRLYLGYVRKPGEFFLERNAHPPTAVLLALPFGRMDYPDAFLAWSLISLAALAVSGGLAVRQLGIRLSVWSVCPVVTLLLVCNPFWQQMNQGQLNLVLLLLLTIVWVGDRSGRPALAGVALGVATAVKLFPGFLFLYFAARRQWRTALAGVASFLAVTALTALVLGSQTYGDYVHEVIPVVAVFRDWWPNASLAGFWAKLFDGRAGKTIPLWHSPVLAQGAYLVSAAVVVAVVARAASRARSRAEQDYAFSLTLTGMLLVSPITWDHYFTMLFLPLVILWAGLPPAGLPRTAYWVLVGFLWLQPLLYWRVLTGATKANWQSLVATPGQTLTALSIQTYALIGLFVLLWTQLSTPPPRADEGHPVLPLQTP
jgi:hypothetical protein